MNKPTLVIIPGLIDSLTCLQLQDRLPGLRVVHIDLLGYGKFREADLATLSLHSQVGHIAGIIEREHPGGVWVLGHSLGGAMALLLARDWPHLVHGLINVEGNFTEQDTFWTKSIASDSEAAWEARFLAMVADPAHWLSQCGIEPSPTRTRWAAQVLANQKASTLYAMSKATMRETLVPDYLHKVRQVVDQGTPIHLIAGERSARHWGVPEDIRSAAYSYTEIPDTGHLMMLEAPELLCQYLERIITDW